MFSRVNSGARFAPIQQFPMSLPGAGWLDADPTSGSVGKMSLVTVAVVRDPDHATPLHDTFIGVALVKSMITAIEERARRATR